MYRVTEPIGVPNLAEVNFWSNGGIETVKQMNEGGNQGYEEVSWGLWQGVVGGRFKLSGNSIVVGSDLKTGVSDYCSAFLDGRAG